MLKIFTETIKCELCGGDLYVDTEETLSDYAIVIDTNIANIFDNVEDIINKHMVYVCMSCGNKVRYTYKEIERLLRKAITEKFLMLVAKGLMVDVTALEGKYFIYCGKCSGYNGRGGCPKQIFNDCSIKRFPINGL